MRSTTAATEGLSRYSASVRTMLSASAPRSGPTPMIPSTSTMATLAPPGRPPSSISVVKNQIVPRKNTTTPTISPAATSAIRLRDVMRSYAAYRVRWGWPMLDPIADAWAIRIEAGADERRSPRLLLVVVVVLGAALASLLPTTGVRGHRLFDDLGQLLQRQTDAALVGIDADHHERQLVVHVD